MDTLVKNPESKVTVRFPDCDPFNHLNNAKYIDYFMNAREDHLMDYYQFDIYEHTKRYGKGWVVTKNEILYLRPASLKEQVVIQSALLQFNQSSLLVEMTMWDESKTQMKALLWATFTYVNLKTQRKATHDSELLDFFEEVIAEDHKPESFDERLYQLKEQNGTPAM